MNSSCASFRVRRVFRDARVTRGNTNVTKLQPIDDASWIWLPGDGSDGHSPLFLRFRREFEVSAGDGPLVIDVSADERFILTCDGEFVARGPNRSTVENWQYGTYELDLKPGYHVLEALVYRVGNFAPLAQLSWRGGFILKASGVYDQRLTTGISQWRVGIVSGIEPIAPAGTECYAWGVGAQWQITGNAMTSALPDCWCEAEVVRGPAGRTEGYFGGGRTPGWMLFPALIPDQTETEVRPGSFWAATHEAAWRTAHEYTKAETTVSEVDEFNSLLREGKSPIVIPAGTRLQLAWRLDRYICAYPLLVTSGGKGARVSWTWSESTRGATDGIKAKRSEIIGKTLDGFGDVFVSDGGKSTFTSPWFRCGLWCRIDIETQEEPLEILSLSMIESRYPLEIESEFISSEDPTLTDIRQICSRAMQMCCHEMLFDCPFYEQQMYPGDSRVQLNVLSAMTRDDRMIKRVIEIFDLGTRDDGQCPFNWPTRGLQEGAAYTLCYLCMFGDYAMNHADREWLRARMPGMRKSMAGMELYENADGLLEKLPGWSFVDWVSGWDRGVPPDAVSGINAEINLLWALAMQSAVITERALGNELQAQYWEAKLKRIKKQIIETFWCEERELLADTSAKRDFSEHTQALAIAGDVLSLEKRNCVFSHLLEDPDLKRCSVYFSYYLFEAYFKMGRGDLFLKRLDLWRSYVEKGLTTTQEAPDTIRDGKLHESRSDCHAWGAHPIWYMQIGLAGIRSAAPFFEKVLIAPSPGGLKKLYAKHPHPKGFIEVDLIFSEEGVSGKVHTPVPGTFAYGGKKIEIAQGDFLIDCLSLKRLKLF